jgi:hypothetical protein
MSGDFPGAFANEADIAAMKKRCADGRWDGGQEALDLSRRDLHQDPLLFRK